MRSLDQNKQCKALRNSQVSDMVCMHRIRPSYDAADTTRDSLTVMGGCGLMGRKEKKPNYCSDLAQHDRK
jgi:hypothetical protein